MADVESDFRERHAPGLVKQCARFIISGPVSLRLEDSAIAGCIRDAWKRESRFPLRLSITLRLAFRHLGLHIFRTAAGGNFVTARRASSGVCDLPKNWLMVSRLIGSEKTPLSVTAVTLRV